MPQAADYPGVSRAHLDIARSYSSPLLLGPPMCDELVALVEHMFTEEEAQVARHIKPMRPKTAASLAAKTGRTIDEVEEILERITREKRVVFYFRLGAKERYAFLPLVPGTFEMAHMRTSTDSVTPWLRQFSSLFEQLYETGFTVEYLHKPVNPVRYLPVGEAIESQPMALPSDRLEVILDRYDDFAVGICQCRLVKENIGEGCGKMLETCTVVGEWAPEMVNRGLMRQASREDVLQIKRAAEKDGLVTWMVNEESGRFTSALCSCCGCCCAALRTVSEFDTPGFIAPPHFMPRIDEKNCTLCEKCVEVCPMKALSVAGEGDARRLVHHPERCIGCGLCVVACPKDAMTMREVPDYREPPGGWLSYLARYVPGYVSNYWKVWSSRR